MRCAGVTVLGWALLAAGVNSAEAGPWARDAGAGFISFQISADEAPVDISAGLWEPDTYSGLFAEFGLGRSFTVGADFGVTETSRQGVIFLQYTLTPPDATWQFAVDAGVGLREVGDDPAHTLLRVGASVGRGFGSGGVAWPMPLQHEGGWLTLDALAYYDLDDEETIWQVEGTAGLRLNDRLAAMFQMKVEDWPNADIQLSVAPSIVIDLSETTSLQVGARAALLDQSTIGLSLSLWHDF